MPREVDDHLRAGHSFFELFSGDGVDATVWRRHDDLVAAPTQNGNGLGVNQASAADHDYLMPYSSSTVARHGTFATTVRSIAARPEKIGLVGSLAGKDTTGSNADKHRTIA